MFVRRYDLFKVLESAILVVRVSTDWALHAYEQQAIRSGIEKVTGFWE